MFAKQHTVISRLPCGLTSVIPRHWSWKRALLQLAELDA